MARALDQEGDTQGREEGRRPMDDNSSRPPRRPERQGSHNYDIESMDGGAGPPWRHHNGSSEALLRFDDGGESVHEPLLRNHTMNATSQIAIVGSNACPIESLDYEYAFYSPPFSLFGQVSFHLFWNFNSFFFSPFFRHCPYLSSYCLMVQSNSQ
jgi:hypothetical protein